MIELPELPGPDALISFDDAEYSRQDMRSYGLSCARAAMERAAQIADKFAKRDFPWGSENADRYHEQADWAQVIAAAIRAEMSKEEGK